MGYVEYINNLIENAEKKVHAGEWLRVGTVHRLLSDLCLKMLDDQQEELILLKRDMFSRGEEELVKKG